MAVITNTYTSDTTVNIPATASNVTITVRSANGGAGGDVPPTSLYSGGTGSTIPGGSGGLGREGTFVYKTDFVARTLTIRIGQPGQTGSTYLQNYFENGFTFPPNCPGGSSNIGAGACGGASNHQVFQSGVTIIYQQSEGGAGAGATGVIESGSAVIVAGGGGGGSGGVYNRNSGAWGTLVYAGLGGGSAGNWSAVAGAVSFSTASFTTSFTSTAGGGGGGSLAGATGVAQFPNTSTPGGGGGSSYNSNIVDLISSSTHNSTQASVTISYIPVPPPTITSFTANPNPQTSGFDGVPNYDTILSWGSTDSASASISGIGAVVPNGSTTVTNLPQSVAGVTSPATITYTLTVIGLDGSAVAQNLTVSAYNDNTPNNYTIPNQSNLDPNTSYTVNIGSITGIDMVTNVVGGPGVTVSKNNLQNYVSSITIVNGDSVQLRFFSDAFNQDPSGLPTVPKTLSVTIGTVTRTFTASTRAPDVNETFNLPDEIGRVPFPDIDTISDPSLPYITSDTLTVDDIELQNPNGVEIKTSNANTQVRINGGPWQDVRSI